MSEHDDGGNGNRATVAMVYRAVDDLSKITQAHFGTVNARLDPLARLPELVAQAHEQIVRIDARVTRIEQSETLSQTAAERRRSYRLGTLPTILISAAGLALVVVNTFVLTSL